MKKIYILLAMVAISTSSCEDFLNTEPVQKISLEQYFTDEAGLTSALAGVYDPLGGEKLYGSQIWYQLESCTDEGFFARATGAGLIGTQVYNFDPTATNVSDMWSECYKGINRANDVIANINLPQMDEAKRQQMLGEALFLRGYYYFMLVVRFGDVPLRLEPTTTPNGTALAKTSTAEVYAQILKDMKAAEGMVSQTKLDFAGRIYKTTVEGILARVCLQMAGYPLNDTSKYAEALSWSKKVIDSGQHSLNVAFKTTAPATLPADYYNVKNPSNGVVTNNGYRQIFIDEAADVYNTNETMWEVEEKGNRTDGYIENGRLGNNNGILCQPTAASIYFNLYGYSFGFVKGTGKLFRSYDATGKDLRRDWVLTTYTINATSGVRTNISNTTANQYTRDCGKWRREYELLTPKNQNYTPINFPLLRYADVLLMYAEAENQVNGPTAAAAEAVNQVRRRGYGQTNVALPYAVSDAATATAVAGGKAGFQLFIEDERMRELCFEGLRRSDLIRWNKFVSTMNAVGADIAANGGGVSYGGLGGKNVLPKHLLFPIPSLEISSNTALEGKNNPGW